jgi:hypothetical protein
MAVGKAAVAREAVEEEEARAGARAWAAGARAAVERGAETVAVMRVGMRVAVGSVHRQAGRVAETVYRAVTVAKKAG